MHCTADTENGDYFDDPTPGQRRPGRSGRQCWAVSASPASTISAMTSSRTSVVTGPAMAPPPELECPIAGRADHGYV
jgi:hypothetical protein